ncbi:WbqC family protein [Paraglaciecola hydrolytica]|uniref:WbqC-like protein n=1 Tax=Paraglaciecola hydrolytica TaxID=1799789 RepID=A0A148KKI5_9ALTE|nr:WbqC family protein [Paraglaciecola hydrolytica]KXI26785.1 hypothetical protein AX660_03175 [Paraglaciecola hydrolytica]
MVTAHQPHFLPWMGYFNKLVNSDIFLVQDNVQFRKLYFQNRTFIKNMHGDKYRLTIPVSFSHSDSIKDVRIANSKWRLSILRTIEYSYCKAPFFDDLWDDIESVISGKSVYLVDITIPLLQILIETLGLNNLKLCYTSDFGVQGSSTQKLILIAEKLGVNRFIFGEGGSLAHHNLDLMKKAGISVVQQSFVDKHPVYPQIHGNFVSELSVIDSLFNVGFDNTKAMLLKAWKI